MQLIKYDSRVYEVGTIIKLVCSMNVQAVCNVASNILQHYELEDIDDINNECIYDAYCSKCGDETP